MATAGRAADHRYLTIVGGLSVPRHGPPSARITWLLECSPNAFLDTAAVMESLDLIITCDTSIAHLAGALGRPTWIALKHAPDWRWMLDRNDSRWFPSVRLFRQKSRGDWEGVFEHMRRELTGIVSQRS
jgi:hypothetical protein